eukprot:855629-Pleurochrysis_carterae.AAC.5
MAFAAFALAALEVAASAKRVVETVGSVAAELGAALPPAALLLGSMVACVSPELSELGIPARRDWKGRRGENHARRVKLGKGQQVSRPVKLRAKCAFPGSKSLLDAVALALAVAHGHVAAVAAAAAFAAAAAPAEFAAAAATVAAAAAAAAAVADAAIAAAAEARAWVLKSASLLRCSHLVKTKSTGRAVSFCAAAPPSLASAPTARSHFQRSPQKETFRQGSVTCFAEIAEIVPRSTSPASPSSEKQSSHTACTYPCFPPAQRICSQRFCLRSLAVHTLALLRRRERGRRGARSSSRPGTRAALAGGSRRA